MRSFCWCKTFKYIASCGLERHLLLWDPYTCKVIATLQGHTASVQVGGSIPAQCAVRLSGFARSSSHLSPHGFACWFVCLVRQAVAANDDSVQLISLAVDKELIVWDARNHIALNRLSDPNQYRSAHPIP